jgi:hypothetical protein
VAPKKQFGIAWILLAGALALHVTDEALTDFLSVWNPLVGVIREHVSFLPLPTFTFSVWLGGLIVGVLLLLTLSPYAFRGSRWTVPLAYFLGIMNVGNGLFHIGGSFYLGRPMSGVYSSPFLIAAAVYLLISVRKRHQWDEASR